MSRSKKAIVIAAAVIALIAVYFLVSFYIMSTVLTAERSEFEDRPESLGLTYEEVEFSPRDWPDLTLRGWWLPAEAPLGSVIQVHGLDSNRAARLELTQAMVENRYSVLAFDLRGNGESDDAQMGASVHEQDDVLGAIDYLLEERGIEPGTILLYGVSYGAAVVLQAGAREPGGHGSVRRLFVRVALRHGGAGGGYALHRACLGRGGVASGHHPDGAVVPGHRRRRGASGGCCGGVRLSAGVGALPGGRTYLHPAPGADTAGRSGGASG